MDNGKNPGALPGVMPVMHTSFFIGTEVEFLFAGFPGGDLGMYVLSLFLVFMLAVAVEVMTVLEAAHTKAKTTRAKLGFTALHVFRIGVSYLIMLSVMSYNVGIFLVAIAGHTFGFMLAGNRVNPRGQPIVQQGPFPNDSAAMKA